MCVVGELNLYYCWFTPGFQVDEDKTFPGVEDGISIVRGHLAHWLTLNSLNLCLSAEEASLCVLSPVCRGTAGSCPLVNQYLSACSQGKSLIFFFFHPYSQHALRLSKAGLFCKLVRFAILFT